MIASVLFLVSLLQQLASALRKELGAMGLGAVIALGVYHLSDHLVLQVCVWGAVLGVVSWWKRADRGGVPGVPDPLEKWPAAVKLIQWIDESGLDEFTREQLDAAGAAAIRAHMGAEGPEVGPDGNVRPGRGAYPVVPTLLLTLCVGCGGAQFTQDACERSAQTVGALSGFARAVCGLAGVDTGKCETAWQVASGALSTYRASCGFLPKDE